MYSCEKGQKILHPQTGPDSDSDETQNVYWRCVFVMFSSYRQFNTTNECLLFCNKMPPKNIDGVNTEELIERLKIQIIPLTEFHLPPTGFSKSWGTQFIIIDIINKLKNIAKDDDEVMVIDSDCIFLKDLDEEITKDLVKYKCLTYTMKFDTNEIINGLTIEEIKNVCQKIGIKNYDQYEYCGGEFFFCLGRELNNIYNMLERIWEDNIILFKNGNKYLKEEAHILSAIYINNEYKQYTANKIIRRIWTDKLRLHDYNENDTHLYIGHFPTEKRLGFKSLWKLLFIKNDSQPLNIFKIMNCYHSIFDLPKIIIRYTYRRNLIPTPIIALAKKTRNKINEYIR